MPLRDHFHPPWSERYHWEAFHSAWVNTIVRTLNGGLLPDNYRAEPQVRLGAQVETDLATWENEPAETGTSDSTNGAVAVWAPPQPKTVLVVDLDELAVCSVRIFDDAEESRLVAVVELVSPANKDRAEHRQAFLGKCIAYLRNNVSLVVVDIVTLRHAQLHRELMELLLPAPPTEEFPDLYAVAFRLRRQRTQHLDTWPFTLEVGTALPTVPLCLNATHSLPLDLEKTYEETVCVLRIR